jgi:hypothetical protein
VGSPLVALVMWTREVIPIVLGTGDISQRQNPMRGILKLRMGEADNVVRVEGREDKMGGGTEEMLRNAECRRRTWDR